MDKDVLKNVMNFYSFKRHAHGNAPAALDWTENEKLWLTSYIYTKYETYSIVACIDIHSQSYACGAGHWTNPIRANS